MFATAVEDGLLRSNPVQRRPNTRQAPTASRRRARRPDARRAALLLAALPAEWRLFFEFLAHTGLRISEAIGLTGSTWTSAARPRVMVREQFYAASDSGSRARHARRDIPLSAGMAERLRARRRDSYRGETAPVFATATGTELNRPNVASRVLKPAAEAVGSWPAARTAQSAAWVGFHTFRHTCASLLFDAGKNVKQVQEWLGHADPGFTLRTYVHLMDEGLGDADFLDDVVGPLMTAETIA